MSSGKMKIPRSKTPPGIAENCVKKLQAHHFKNTRPSVNGVQILLTYFIIFGVFAFPIAVANPMMYPDPVDSEPLRTNPSINSAKSAYDKTCFSEECQKASERIQKTMDTSIDPCVDFYQFACGSWISNQKEIQKRDNTSFTSQFTILEEQLNAQINEILEERQKSEDSLGLTSAKNFYEACKRNANGDRKSQNTELRNFIDYLLTEIENVTNLDRPELGRTLGKIRRELGGKMTLIRDEYIGGNYMFTINTEFDRVDLLTGVKTPLYELQLSPPVSAGTMMGVPDEYAVLLEDLIVLVWQVIYPEESTFIETTQKIASRIAEFETSLVQLKASPTSPWDQKLYRYDFVSPEGLHIYSENVLDWVEFLEELYKGTNVTLNLDTLRVSVLEVQYFKNLKSVFNQFSLADIKNFLKLRIIFDLAHTNDDLREIFESSELGLTYILSYRSPSECTTNTQQYFSTSLTSPFIRNHFKENLKVEAGFLVEDLKEAFNELLEENYWLDLSDIVAAKEKNKAMRVQIAYPNSSLTKLEDDKSGILQGFIEPTIAPESSYFRNTLDALRFESMKRLQRLDTAKSYDEWVMTPLEVNSGYFKYRNTFTITAATLQIPFYNNPMQYLNFGAMGSGIGHEITHGFDSDGRLFDEDGSLNDWWQPATSTESACYVVQYDGYVDSDCDLHVNGTSTLDENIADDGGVRMAYRAYQNYIKRSQEPEKFLPDLKYTPNQMFFVSFAQAFCEARTNSSCRNKILRDEHSSGRIRIKGALENFEEFHKAWNCPVPQPDSTCRIW